MSCMENMISAKNRLRRVIVAHPGTLINDEYHKVAWLLTPIQSLIFMSIISEKIRHEETGHN